MSQLVLKSDPLQTAAAGVVEYDGKVFYGTPQGTQRGVIPGSQFYRLNANLAGANVATVQSVFNVGVTLSASTVYAFEAMYVLNKTAGTTSHTIGLGFGGTATLNNVYYSGLVPGSTGGVTSGNDTTPAAFFASTATNTVMTAANATANNLRVFSLRGTVSINAGGTFIPQYTLSAAPGGAYSTVAGSYFSIYPIGSAGSNTNVGTWA